MQLFDDALFYLWRDEKVTAEDCLAKSHTPEDLAQRIASARKGTFDDEDDVADAVASGKNGEGR